VGAFLAELHIKDLAGMHIKEETIPGYSIVSSEKQCF
jgi:hypothetical protein